MNGGFGHVVTRSTIGARLAVVLIVPLLGLALFGSVVAEAERNAMVDARALRREAELVELLSTAALRTDMEFDSLAGLREASGFGLDPEHTTSLVGPAFDSFADTQADIDDLLDRIEAEDPSAWADPDAVEAMVAARAALVEARRSTTPDDRFAEARTELSDPLDRALDAQTDRLDTRLLAVELDPGLASIVRSMERSRQLLTAVQDERRALSEYLLPITDDPAEDRLSRLTTAAARADLLLDDLRHHLAPDHAADLAALEALPGWVSYRELRDQAIAGDVGPPAASSSPVVLLPYALTSYIAGFERARDLLDLDRRLSAELTGGTLAIEQEATDRLLRSGVAGLALGGCTLGISFLAIRSITGPMRELQTRAERITDGDLSTGGPDRGPSDIYLVHAALDAMSANLRTLSAQTEALSEGRLEDEILSRTVAGPLGASVHGSVARLRSVTARLEYEASHDALTGLPNRSALLSLLDRCLTGDHDERTALAVVMLDLDGFKQTNDDMGHGVGDEVLIQVGRRLRRSAGGGFVARLGGDEFMVVVTGPGAAERAGFVAAAAIEAINSPIAVTGGTAAVSASAGTVDTAGPDWLSPSELLRRVDLALYDAKLDGPGQVVRFDQRLHDSLLETTMLQGELRHALDHDELSLHLQPILAIADRSVSGYEALIRWCSPVRGLMPPGLFIPVAEQSELIVQIDRWVIDRAVALLADLQRSGRDSPVTMSINVSARHLSNPALVASVAGAVERHGAEPDGVIIEITESQLIPHLSRAESSLRGLKALGVKLAIDDFGTGYASVAHLRRVAFDRLKIDRSFLAHLDDETDRALAGLLVSLGRDLDLEVVAEGIETEAQLDWARSAGCTHAQGYLLGRPAPALHPGGLGDDSPAPPVGGDGPMPQRTSR